MEIDGTNNSVGGSEEMCGLSVDLPWDIICDILLRLPIESLMRFTCVAKAWYRLTKDPNFIHLQLSLSKPRIIIENVREKNNLSLYLIDEGKVECSKCKGREIPIRINLLAYSRSLAACNGLLCVCASPLQLNPLFIYNPITRDSLMLPSSTQKVLSMSVGFGFDSRNKNYKVVRLFKMIIHGSPQNDYPPVYIVGEIIALGESSWRQLDIPYIVLVGTSQPVFSNGALHWIINKEIHQAGPARILVLDICNESFRTIDFSITIKYPLNLMLYNFGESLALVEPGPINQIRVCKIMGNNTDGYRFHKKTHLIPVISEPHKDIFRCLLFLGFWSTDMFLLKYKYVSIPKNDELALYCPMKKEMRIAEVSGIPAFFRTIIFVPRPSAFSSERREGN